MLSTVKGALGFTASAASRDVTAAIMILRLVPVAPRAIMVLQRRIGYIGAVPTGVSKPVGR